MSPVVRALQDRGVSDRRTPMVYSCSTVMLEHMGDTAEVFADEPGNQLKTCASYSEWMCRPAVEFMARLNLGCGRCA